MCRRRWACSADPFTSNRSFIIGNFLTKAPDSCDLHSRRECLRSFSYDCFDKLSLAVAARFLLRVIHIGCIERRTSDVSITSANETQLFSSSACGAGMGEIELSLEIILIGQRCHLFLSPDVRLRSDICDSEQIKIQERLII